MTETRIQKYITEKSRGRSEFEINALSTQIPKKIAENENLRLNMIQGFQTHLSDLRGVGATLGDFEELRASVNDMCKKLTVAFLEYNDLRKSYNEIIDLNNAFAILDLVRSEKKLEGDLLEIKKARIDCECALSKSDPDFRPIGKSEKLIIPDSDSEDSDTCYTQ